MMLAVIAAAPTTQVALPRDVVYVDPAGQSHRLFDGQPKAVVLLFAGVECPVSNSYVPEINRLTKQYAERGVAFFMVYSGTDVTADAVAKHVKDFAIACSAAVDTRCELANVVGATMTLEAVVLNGDAALLYRGRLDDQYFALGKKRFAPTTHDLQDLLNDVLAGTPIEPRFTRAVGCAIVKPERTK